MSRPSQHARRALLLWALACTGLAACNPNPPGRCEAQADCPADAGLICSATDHLCESSTNICSPACDGGTTCAFGTCVGPGQPAVQIEIAPNALLSPASDQVDVAVIADPTVLLGQLSVQARALDGGLLASGMVAQASADAGVQLTVFEPGAQGPANLVATLDYTNGSMDAGGAGLSVSSALVPVRIDAVPPSVSLTTSDSGLVDGWYARTDGGFSVFARIDDSPHGSGPDGGVLKVTGCASPAVCAFAGALLGPVDAGAGVYQFQVPLSLADAGSEGPLAYSLDAVDNAGNRTDQSGSVLVDDKAPVTDAEYTIVNPDAGAVGEDARLWFPAGTHGVDVDVAIGAADDGVGLDPTHLLLTLLGADLDSGQDLIVVGNYASGEGRVHFIVSTGLASHREGQMRFAISISDKLGHQAAPVGGHLFIDDLPPTVSLAQVDYTNATIQPAREAVCAPAVVCGRGPSGAPDHALRDDLVTATFTVVDCGAGVDTGALPTIAARDGAGIFEYTLTSVKVGSEPGACANGSTNLKYDYKLQVPLGAAVPTLTTDAGGHGQVYLSQVAYDLLGGQGFSAAPSAGGGIIAVSRVRWSAPLGGRATGDPALVPLLPGEDAGTARKIAVPVDGASDAAAPEAIDLFDGTGALYRSLTLTANDGGTYDRATGDVALGSAGSIWIAGSSGSCGIATCSHLWGAQLGAAGPPVECPQETGVIGSLAIRQPADAGSEVAVVGVADAGSTLETVTSYALGGSCVRESGTTRVGVPATTGIALAQGDLFVASASGFFSVPIASDGSFGALSSQAAFTDTGNGALNALPAAPSILVSSASAAGTPYFSAVDSLTNLKKQALREAVSGGAVVVTPRAPPERTEAGGGCTGNCWTPAAAPWDSVSLSAAPVLHTPVFDSTWLYTVDTQGTLQLTSLSATSGQLTTATLGPGGGGNRAARLGAGSGAQLVSAPVLVQGSAAGSSALLVQNDGSVELVAVVPSSSGKAPTLAAETALAVAAFQTGVRPPAPVLDVRGTGSVAYVIDGAGCTSGTSCGAATVWALQLDEAPVTASASIWPRPAHDSCNSRDAEGTCP